MTAVNEPVPLRVMCDILGAPYDDHDKFNAWVEVATNLSGPTEDVFTHAMEEFQHYMDSLVRAKLSHPEDDLLSELARKEADGTLTHRELVHLAMLLLLAGHDNTAATLGLGEVMLLASPGRIARLATSPPALAGAVEEVLRHQTIVHLGRPRVATRDCELGGALIHRGDAVVVMLPAANRDPRVFSDPERFDITRSPNPHLGFGHSIHYCVGHALARLELRIVLGSLAARLPRLRLATGIKDLRWRSNHNAYGVQRVPVMW